MPTNAKPLPPGWSQLLDEIGEHLNQAISATDARIDETTAIDLAQLAEQRRQDAARLEACLEGLSAQLESAEQLAQEVDAALLKGEQTLERQVTSSGTLRQRLAEWAGRAIG